MHFPWKALTVLFSPLSPLGNTNKHSSSLFSESPVVTYEVCLSPACIADGAEQTLEKLHALAPPNVAVCPGVCCSLCGNGPIVLEQDRGPDGRNDGKGYNPNPDILKKHRKVSGPKVLTLLKLATTNDSKSGKIETGPPEELVQGYELALQADGLFARKQYAQCVPLYEQAISLAFRPAINLQTERDHFLHKKYSDKKESLAPLAWLIRSRRQEAEARLFLATAGGGSGEYTLESALLAAQASCNLSQNTDTESFQVLADIYQQKKDAVGEMQALQKMFALADAAGEEEESKLSFATKNRRREAGFRLAKLESEQGIKNSK